MANLKRLETGKLYTAQLVSAKEMDGRGIACKFRIQTEDGDFMFTKQYWYGTGGRAPMIEMERKRRKFREEIGEDFEHVGRKIGSWYHMEKKEFQGNEYLELKGEVHD